MNRDTEVSRDAIDEMTVSFGRDTIKAIELESLKVALVR